jgi:predicted nucleic acid-binding protein
MVVDTTVVIAVILNEAHKPELLRVTEGADLVAPPSLHWEVGNALSAMFKRNRLSHDDAQAALELYNDIPIRVTEVPLDEAVRAAAELDVYAYDAYMIVAARRTGFPLLTLDGGLAAAANRAGVNVLKVSI